jgi:hypothetical protein
MAEEIRLTKRDTERLRVIHRIMDGLVGEVDAGLLIGITDRQVRTLQDRLVKDMRLVGIRTMEEANRLLEHWLPSHNQRFAWKALEPGVDPQRRSVS